MDSLNLGELVPLGRDMLKLIEKHIWLVAGVLLGVVGLIAWGRKPRGVR